MSSGWLLGYLLLSADRRLATTNRINQSARSTCVRNSVLVDLYLGTTPEGRFIDQVEKNEGYQLLGEHVILRQVDIRWGFQLE